MVKIKLLITIILISLTSCTKEVTSTYVVQIDNENLTYTEFKKIIKLEINNLNQYKTLEKQNLKLLINKVINNFVYKTLIKKWAQQNSVFIHPNILNEKINHIKKNYPNKSYFESELHSQNLSEEMWINKMKFSLLEEKVLAIIKKKLPEPTEEDLKLFYDNNLQVFYKSGKIKIRQIMTTDESLANKAFAALRNKFSFIHAYKKYSYEYEQHKQPQIIWVNTEKTSLFKGLSKLKKGQYSEIFKSDFGYHIAQLLDRKKGKQLSYKEAKKQVSSSYKKVFNKNQQINWLKSELKNKKVLINKDLVNKIRIEQKDK